MSELTRINKEGERQSDDKSNLQLRVSRKRQKINYDGILKELQTSYPVVFTDDEQKTVPLKIGIYKDIVQNAELMNKLNISRAAMSRFMFCYVNRTAYLGKLLEGNARYDLNGKQIGEVTEEQASYALMDMQKLQAEEKQSIADIVANN